MDSYLELDTPALLVDKQIMEKNIARMMAKAKSWNVKLRPHTKTHRTPALAKLQIAAGASGITVAKVGEAEVMASEGLTDIFIANEIYGTQKIKRLLQLNRKIRIAVGVDNVEQIMALAETFADEDKPLDLMIEVETGEDRTGVLTKEAALVLGNLIQEQKGLRLRGVFTHDGHSYGAPTPEACIEISRKSQQDILTVAEYLRQHGIAVEEISVGSTPSMMHGGILPGVTEIRPGTYIFMDAAQGHAIEDYTQCALSVLVTAVSKPTQTRLVVDAGGKALTSFTRAQGICYTPGYGLIKGFGDLRISKVYDEHGVINSAEACRKLKIGDKIEIIPNHACPTVNLYDNLHLVENGQVVEVLPVLCRGKSQ